MNHLLIDADILLFKATVHCEKPIEWSEGFWTMHGFEDDALLFFNDKITEWKDKFETEKVTLCLTDTENWRKEVLPSYKEHRKATRKPLILPVVRQRLLEDYDAVVWPTLEADDVLGIMATEDTDENRIIISSDKDLKTIPAPLYNPDKDILTENSVFEADYWHMFQTLVGDATDGYSGCPTIGPVSATKLLSIAFDQQAMWDLIVATYSKKGLSASEALVQARVARILRFEDFNNKEITYWNPPQIS